MEYENSYVDHMDANDTISSIQIDKNLQNELDVYLEDYKNKSTEIQNRLEFQQKLLNYQIIFGGALITAGVSLQSYLSANPFLVRYFLLFSPFPFYFLSWSFSNHDLMIVALARYINIELRPRIIELVGGRDTLRFEEFLGKERDQRAKTFGNISTMGEEYLLPLIFPAIFILIYIAISYDGLFRIISDKTVFSFLQNNLLYVPQIIIFIINIYLFYKTKKLRDDAGENYGRILKRDL